MQTTDLIGTGIALLGTRLLAEGPVLLASSHDDTLQLNLSGQSPEYLLVPFFPHPETPLTFAAFLENIAQKGARSIRMISSVSEDCEGLPGRIREGFQGGSQLMLAVQFENRILAYKPHIHQEANTDLELLEILTFLDRCESRDEIETLLLTHMESPQMDLEAMLIKQGSRPSRHLYEVLSLLFSSPQIHEEDRLAWRDMVRTRQVDKEPSIPFLFEEIYEGDVHGPEIQETLPAYREALEELIVWCGLEGLETWQHRYVLALQDLSQEDPEAVHPVFRLVNEYCPTEISRFFRSSSRAWAFGGLNSWNDLPHTGTDRYEELSQNLLLGIKAAILTTANWEFQYSRWC